jgi:methionyl aminopeptidase
MGMSGGARLKKMSESGRIVRKVLDELRSFARPGVTTAEMDSLARAIISAEHGTPSFLGYRGYPAAVCISLGSEVVHGIPGGRRLAEGQIVSVDVGVFKDGYHGDAADSFLVGKTSDPLPERLIEVTYEGRRRAIQAARSGNRLGDIGSAVQEYVESMGFSVVRDLVGHGIGRKLHEPPQVPNFGSPGQGSKLTDGLALAIEPMVNAGTADVRILDDGWTVVTADGSLSAHAEHTVMVAGGEPLVLTA